MTNKMLVRIAILLLVLGGFGTGSAWAQSILIFSTSHSNTGPSQVQKPEGVLKLVISTFSPIREIRINEKLQPAPTGTIANLDIPLSLQEGENRFTINIVTEKAKQQKDFVLIYSPNESGTAGAQKKKPFQLIAVAGLTHTDNAAAVKDNKTAGTKLILTVIPRYKLALNQDSDLLFQGIALREKYSDSDLENLETVFTQVSADWKNRSGFGDWQVGAGWQDIGGKLSGLTADTKVETDMFLEGSIRLKALDQKRLKLGLRYTLVDAEEASSSDYDGDGALTTLNVEWNRKIIGISGAVKGAYDFNDAKGMYEDYSALTLGVDGNYPLNKKLTVGGKLRVKQTVYAETDPIKGDKEASTLYAVSATGDYKLPDLFGMIASGSLTLKQRSSNIETKEYSETVVNLGIMYIY